MIRSLLLFALAAAPLLAGAQAGKPDQSAPPYKVGDRLEAQKAARADGRKGAERYREVKWDDLISPSWNPDAIIKSLNLDMMQDSDARAIAAMQRLKEEWNRAPANPALDGSEVKLAGFVVPLERDGDSLREFLLVPYFGACIHVPPPPANQIVRVVTNKAVANAATMDAVWVSGKLALDAVVTNLGRSAYRLDAASVEPYKPRQP